jgi:hypothetical protein
MSLHRSAKPTALILVAFFVAPLVWAQDPVPDVWDRLRGMVAQEGEQLEEVLQEQSEMEIQEAALQEQLEEGRRVRAMYREAVLLSALNVGWIQDQIEHWDCRLGEQKVHEVENRLEELTTFGERLDTVCGELGPEAGHQQGVCERERRALAQSAASLEDLGRRYAMACAGTSE